MKEITAMILALNQRFKWQGWGDRPDRIIPIASLPI